MISRRLKWPVGFLLLATWAAGAQDKSKAGLEKIPSKVIDALTARFPNPEIHRWTRETEGEIVIYDIEFRMGGRKFEADIKEDGSIHNWEKEIPIKELPAVVRKAVDTRYPKATLTQVMAITAVKDGKDAPEAYEIVLEATGKKGVEITVAPDGKIIEDSGAEK